MWRPAIQHDWHIIVSAPTQARCAHPASGPASRSRKRIDRKKSVEKIAHIH
jgi:hypothetical protein